MRIRLQRDDAVFNVARPEELMEQPLLTQQQESCCDAARPLPVTDKESKAANSFTYKKMKGANIRAENPWILLLLKICGRNNPIMALHVKSRKQRIRHG
jgi:hypothetical protein